MRPPRLVAADVPYHVTSRGNRREAIVRDDLDRRRFLSILRSVVLTRRWRCSFYCLMTNHYHLMVTSPQPDLPVGMHAINFMAARTFNKRHGYTGHLFEKRYGAQLIESESHLLETYRYIALNPVRAGLCADPAEWPWSSYGATIGLRPLPDFLDVDDVLLAFSQNPDRARSLLRAFVLEGLELQRAA